MCTSICISFLLVWSFPLRYKCVAHENLSVLFVKNIMNLVCICNDAKEIIHGMFYQNLKNVLCQLNQLKSYTFG